MYPEYASNMKDDMIPASPADGVQYAVPFYGYWEGLYVNKAVMEALDGLPPVKVHCSLLAEEAIHAALWDYAQKHHIEIKGLKKPKSDIHEGEEAEEEEY